MTFHATVARASADRDEALVALRGRLRQVTAQASAGAPDWSSLVVQGPSEVPGIHGRTLYVWLGTVESTLGTRAA